MKRRSLPLLALFITAAAVPLACASKKPNPVVAQNHDGGLYYDPHANDAGTTTIALDDAGFAIDGGGFGGFTTASAPTSTLGLPALGVDAGASAQNPSLTPEQADLAIDAALAAAAAKLAPKMEKEGAPGRATLKEGEHFAMLVTMSPGRCYTMIGFSPAGGVTQLDMKLFAPPLYNLEAGRSATAEKNQPVIGKTTAAMCPFLPLAVAYKIDAGATKGAGRIGIQVFSRSK